MDELIAKWLESNYKNFQNKFKGTLTTENGDIVTIGTNEINHITDWLKSDDAERHRKRIERLSVPDAYRLSNIWTNKLNRSFERNQEVEQDLDGIEVMHEFSNGFKMVKINSQYSYQREGSKMGHCVATYYSKPQTIFSLRDADNEPHCTIEYDHKRKIIQQVKGKGNKEVIETYHSFIISFLNTIPFEKLRDSHNFNVLAIGNYLLDLNAPIPKKLVINKNACFENIKLDITFDELIVNGDFKINSIRGQNQLAKKITVNGDLLIEKAFGILRLTDELEVLGDVELVDSNQMKILSKESRIIGNVLVEDCEQFIQDIKCDGIAEYENCPKVKIKNV